MDQLCEHWLIDVKLRRAKFARLSAQFTSAGFTTGKYTRERQHKSNRILKIVIFFLHVEYNRGRS